MLFDVGLKLGIAQRSTTDDYAASFFVPVSKNDVGVSLSLNRSICGNCNLLLLETITVSPQ